MRLNKGSIQPLGLVIFAIAGLVFFRVIPVEHGIDPDLATLAILASRELLGGVEFELNDPGAGFGVLILVLWVIAMIIGIGALVGILA